MVSRQRWAEFFAWHSEQHPGGVIDRLLGDWQRAKAQPVSRERYLPPAHGQTHSSPGHIARMVADGLRRGR